MTLNIAPANNTNSKVLQYFCFKCNALLKETSRPIAYVSTSERCPSCGSLLVESLRERILKVRPTFDKLWEK